MSPTRAGDGRVRRWARAHPLITYTMAAGLTRVADACVSIAIVLLALRRTGHASIAGLLVAAYTLPALASGPLLGAWLDRTARRRAALAANEALLAVCMIGLVHTVGHTPLGVSFALSGLAGMTLPLTSAGFTSMIPGLVGPGALGRANTLDAITFNGASVLGPAIAGGLAAAFGPTYAMYAVAVIAALAVPATFALPIPPPSRAAAASLWHTARAGLRHLAHTPALRGGTATTVIAHGATGVLAVGLPYYARHFGARDSTGGWLWGALEIGAVIGAVAAGRSLARWSAERVILGGTALFGIGMSLWPLAGSLITGGLLIALAGVLTGPVLVATFTLRQQYAPPNLLAQVSATAASLKIGAFAIGSAIGGWLVPTVGVFYAVAIVAAMQLVAAGIGLIGGAGCTDRQSNRHYNPEGCAERQSA